MQTLCKVVIKRMQLCWTFRLESPSWNDAVKLWNWLVHLALVISDICHELGNDLAVLSFCCNAICFQRLSLMIGQWKFSGAVFRIWNDFPRYMVFSKVQDRTKSPFDERLQEILYVLEDTSTNQKCGVHPFCLPTNSAYSAHPFYNT